MITVNQNFQEIAMPVKAMLIYQSIANQADMAVEAYDIDESGNPYNAHPLSLDESISFARCLAASDELNSGFLQSRGIVPEPLLYTSFGLEGFAIWYTPPQIRTLHFIDSLGIASGAAHIPALIWKADKKDLQVFSVKLTQNIKPTLDTPLYHAPFFNIYQSGKVCMGNVKVGIPEGCFLEDFISLWENYFFSSFFSHTMAEHLPVKTNIVQLWQSLVGQPKLFPDNVLRKTGGTVKNLF